MASVDGRYVAKGQLKIVGTGARIDSTIELSPLGSGCVYEIDLEVTAKVPLIRRKLEAFVGDTALRACGTARVLRAPACGTA